MAIVDPVLLNKIKSHFRKQHIIVNPAKSDDKSFLIFIKKKHTHLKKGFHDIVITGLYHFWSGFKIVEDNPVELKVWTNPPYIRVIQDDPALAFKIGMYYKDIIHKYECKLRKNPTNGYLILEFQNEADAIAFRLEYG